jgi:cysteine desulfurase
MIYMDHAATTPLDPAVLEAMMPYLTTEFANPNSLYSAAQASRKAVDEARERVAALLGATASEIVFTGCGTEADNLAIRGVAAALRERGNHIITSAIEHHAVLHTCEALEKMGFAVTYLPVDQYGIVNPESVREAISPRTILISIMHANNEIGTIQPIAEIGAVAREHGIPFHTDAVQTVGKIPTLVNELSVDLLSLSAHKLYGPKGVGALYVRRGTKLTPQITGGGQERKRRSGTENVAGIVGLGKAAELASRRMADDAGKEARLRDRLIAGITSAIDEVILTGHPTQRLPNLASFCVRYIEGESMLLLLDHHGIAASSGSACTSGSLDPSHVLLAIGLPHEIAHGSLRLSLGRDNTDQDVDRLLEVLPPIVQRLREMSPLYPRRARAAQAPA